MAFDKGPRCAIQVVRGELVVCLLPCLLARQAPDLEAFVQHAHHTTFASCDVFRLRTGDSLTIPLGFTILPMSIKTNGGGKFAVNTDKKRARTVDEHAAYMVYYPFSTVLDSKHPPETQTWAESSYTTGITWFPVGIRSHEKIAEWRKALECAPTVVVDAEASAVPANGTS